MDSMASDRSPTMGPGGGKGKRAYPVLSRREIEGMIAEGRLITIVDQHVLKMDAWIKYHPGGEKSIQHMVGRDSTDEVTCLHSPEALVMMQRYRIGRIEGSWEHFLPPIQGGIFRPLNDDGVPEIAREQQEEHGQAPRTADDSSTHTGSRSPSPVFDSETNASGLRARHGEGNLPGSPSVSSISSFEDDAATPFDGMAHLDMLTKKEIKLDLERYPSLDQTTQDHICQKYRELHEKVKAEGLYDCHYYNYAIETLRYVLLFSLSMLFLRWRWYFVSACFLGAWWHQLMFFAHDAGHISITHNYHVDSVLGILVADFLGGLSLGWWKRNHNVHHIVTNSPEHDPDIEHIPVFAVSHRFLQSLRSTYYDRVMTYDAAAKFMLRVQHHLYYFILLFGRFNLYRLSWEYLILGQGPKKGPAAWHRYLEMAGQVFFWSWFGYGIIYKSIDSGWARLMYIIVSHWITSPVHVQITLSHFAMSTADLGKDESFPQKTLRTTMDVDCPEWLDFIHGGLQFQAIHHLFPRLPRHNLRRAQKMVQEFCNEVGIPYALYGFVDGNQVVIGRLADVAKQAAILAKCQKVMATTGIGNPLHEHH